MKPRQTQLPKGTRIYLPDEAERKRHVDECCWACSAAGYREIVADVRLSTMLATGTDVDVQGNMFTLVDRETGRTLALRPISRPRSPAWSRRACDEPKPSARLTNVFRTTSRVSLPRVHQAGVELVGLGKRPVEVIAMAIQGLRALGLERFKIVRAPGFFRGPRRGGADAARGVRSG